MAGACSGTDQVVISVITCKEDVEDVLDKSAMNVNIYPNPSIDGKVFVTFSGYEGLNALITIYNVTGQKIYERKISDISALQTERIDITEQTGIYMMRIETDTKTEIFKLLVR